MHHHLMHVKLSLTILKALNAVYSRVLEYIFFVRMNPRESRLHRERSFMETAQDQLQLVLIGVDITDRINSWNVR